MNYNNCSLKYQHIVRNHLKTNNVARLNKHFGDHRSRHAYSNKNFPNDINRAMRKIWFAYADLGYDGVNGNRAKQVIENIKKIVTFFEERFGIKIHEEDI